MDVPGDPTQQDASKPYFCTVCGDNFKRHEHLIRHSRRHTQEKPFKCDVCNKEFARRDILSRHAIVHVPAAERATLPQKTQKRGTKRVQQACNNCAKGKCRCDGETPCSTCQSKNLENCEYTMSTTPSKRKRADSSASTAAANVLLQVASSAHASPKGDWSLDYTANHNETSMQPPQPIVFGYQPTFNGSLQLDPFGYGISRPESRLVSCAPSPSHDFDEQFENALPAASSFGFLFKDSARELPGISAILPRLMPVPGLPSDFISPTYTHANGSSEQPGIYSNYRNEHATNINNAAFITRPPSPILSFPELDIPHGLRDLEDSPHVDAFTDIDRSLLQEYTQTQLPSARLINILIQLYFDHFHVCLPIIHLANYSPGQSGQILTLAIMVIGAQYLEQGISSGLYQSFVVLTHRILKLEPESFTALQAQFLIDVADLYNVQSQSVLEATDDRRSSLLRKARAKKLFDENYDDSPPDDASTEARWQILRRAEERRRLSWAIWIYDYLSTILFGVRSLMEVNEVRTSLPCHENLWNAVTARDWAAQFAPDRLPLRTRTLWSIGRLEDRGEIECREYGIFCRSILAFVESRRVHDIACAVPVTDPDTEGVNQRSLRKDAEAVLHNAKMMSTKAFDVLESSLSFDIQDSEIETHNAMLNLHFARMITHIDLSDIRKYLFGDDRTIRYWAGETPLSARAASLSAAHIASMVTDSHPSPFAGIIGFYATLTLFCFANYYPANEALRQIQLDERSYGSEQGKQWILEGAFIPTVKNIGLLGQTNLSRILQSWDSHAERGSQWGYETLKLRIEALLQHISE